MNIQLWRCCDSHCLASRDWEGGSLFSRFLAGFLVIYTLQRVLKRFFGSLGSLGSVMANLDPVAVERDELGFSVETIRGKSLRVVVRVCSTSEVCVFFVHGGGGRAGQFKHQIRRLEKEYAFSVLFSSLDKQYFIRSYNVVALDFLGHGGSPSPNQPRLYTVNEVDLAIAIKSVHCFTSFISALGRSRGCV